MQHEPSAENETLNNDTKIEFSYCDEKGQPIFKTRELFKKTDRIVIYPYSVNSTTGEIGRRKLLRIEFVGWSRFDDVPKDFRGRRFGMLSPVLRIVLANVYSRFKTVSKLRIVIGGRNRFNGTSATFKWEFLDNLLKEVRTETTVFQKNRKDIIVNRLAESSSSFVKRERFLGRGELGHILSRYHGAERATKEDIQLLTEFLDKLPLSKITVTTNFIQTKERINVAFLEDVIEQFDELAKAATDNEEKWHKLFEKNAWVFSHLLPFEALLHKSKAYLGGKTVDNSDGRIVDFLFQSGFKDNFALLEIKTHITPLMVNSAYRQPDVFSMDSKLSGAINQCLDQKDALLNNAAYLGIRAFDPKCILIVGRKGSLNGNQKKCFELIRTNQKHVEIVTFDELREKLDGLRSIMRGELA